MSSSETPETRALMDDESPLPGASGSPMVSFSARHRPGYTRVASVTFSDGPTTRDMTETATDDEIVPIPGDGGRSMGLGISRGSPAHGKRKSLPSPLQRESNGRYSTPEHGSPMFSPPSTGALSGSTRFDDSFDADTDYKSTQRAYRDSRTSLNSANAPSTYAKSDTGLLSVRSRYNDFAPHDHCQSKKAVKSRKLGNWISITILFLAIFASLFSAAFLVIALRGPRYGRTIRRGGALTPASAAFLTSLFAKLIELAYVTVVVAFVGQALARRAFKQEQARGVTLAELSMRSWIMQPGTMITHWESVRYAGVSVLGLISFLAALMAVLYTSAATALVQPQLVIPNFASHTLQGLVKSQFANPTYIATNCQTPIVESVDSQYYGTTCLQITHSSMAFHSYQNFLATWTNQAVDIGNSTSDLSTRPPGYALFTDNTSIIAPWIEHREVSQAEFPGFIINNVTMAMPHVGVVQAAIDPINGLVQPYEVEGASYNIRAAVASPMVNVMCATLNEDQMKPFIYNQWSDRNQSACNETSWVDWPLCLSYPNGTGNYLNLTEGLYDVFRWGAKYGDGFSNFRYPPVFARLPADYNTVVNDTVHLPYGSTAIYILAKGGTAAAAAGNYSLCQLQAGQTPNCTTHYNATSNGGEMEAICDTNDMLQYNRSVPEALHGNATLSKDWVNIASEWAHSLSLGAGQYDGNASNARLLSQFIVTSGNLSTKNPSMAEALAVLAGDTLILSAQDAPFHLFWNYTNTVIEGSHQTFNASLRVQQYASGGNQPYQKPFYIVLFIVCIMNASILVYFLLHRDWYTDFSEPVNLFSLAVNSPPSEELAGACGCGPQGEQYRVSWKMHRDGEHFYVESQEKVPLAGQESGFVRVEGSPTLSRKRWTETFEMVGSPVQALKSRFGN